MIFIVIIFVGVFARAEHLYPKIYPGNRISVAVSERTPFVILDQNGGPPTGLDVSIMENFAKRFRFKIDYCLVNSSLNYTFAKNEHSNTLLVETIPR